MVAATEGKVDIVPLIQICKAMGYELPAMLLEGLGPAPLPCRNTSLEGFWFYHSPDAKSSASVPGTLFLSCWG